MGSLLINGGDYRLVLGIIFMLVGIGYIIIYCKVNFIFYK